ncbi:hypothetical protein [Marmoricola endophyticus]|uniref:hypothetical protein n=1 Tax=Marmoricola endophyticus TaxID=2040280 RepID=UPI0016651450|nr:hypothetical protein [Marmoricola endophyticus]
MDRQPVLGRVVAGLLVLALVLGGAAVALAGVLPGGVRSALPGADECRVSVDGADVELTTEEAEDAASRVADGQVPGALTPAEASAVTAALSGRAPAALTCEHGPGYLDDADDQSLGPQGLTARAAAVRRELDAAFGRQRVGGFAPGGVSTGHSAGSAHYEGRAVDVFYRPVSAASRTRGWATAQWLVAHAERLSVRTVIFDDRIWSSGRSSQGWRDYEVDTSGRDAATAAILEHRDHVHVDVA